MSKSYVSKDNLSYFLTKIKKLIGSIGDYASLCNSNSTSQVSKTITSLANYKKILITIEDASKNILTSTEIPVALFKAKASVSLRLYEDVQNCPTGIVTYVSDTSVKLQIANYSGTSRYVYVYGVK